MGTVGTALVVNLRCKDMRSADVVAEGLEDKLLPIGRTEEYAGLMV